MAVRTKSTEQTPIPGVHYVTREEGVAMLDYAARKYLDMTGEEFVRRYRANDIPDPDRTEVIRVAFLMRYAE
jgi:hypothetical protein